MSCPKPSEKRRHASKVSTQNPGDNSLPAGQAAREQQRGNG